MPTVVPAASSAIAAELIIDRLLILTGVFVLLAGGILIFLSLRVQAAFWSPATKEADATWRTYLTQLPLGAPEGSVRALISIYVIVFGLLVLVLQNQLGLTNADAISGFVGIVITFYFTSRATSQNARVVSSAADAASEAADRATAAVVQSRAQVGDAVAAVNQVVQHVHGAAAKLADITGGVQQANRLPGAAIAQGQSELHQVRSDLQLATRVLGAFGSLDEGHGIVGNVETLTRTAGGVLDMIDPLLTGSPDPAKIGDVTARAQGVLATVQNAGLPGLLGDAVAGLGGTLGALAPIITGLTGGPIGLVGGIVMSGIKLLQQKQQFDAWEVALLRPPFNRALMPPVVDGTVALAALQPAIAPLMAARVGAVDQPFATELMRAMLALDTDGHPKASAVLARELLASGPLAGKFGSEAELVEAIDQYRGGIGFLGARAQLAGSVDIPAIGQQPARQVDIGKLVDAAAQLAVDPRSASEVERLVSIVQALGKLGLDPDRLSGLVQDALGKAAGIAASSRETTDPRRPDAQP